MKAVLIIIFIVYCESVGMEIEMQNRVMLMVALILSLIYDIVNSFIRWNK